MNSIILTGGGTAGHVMPNIALLPQLKQEFQYIHYIGTKDGIEKDILSSYKYVKYHTISATKLKRSLTLENLLIPIKLLKSVIEAKKIIKRVNPKIVFSKGGFVSLPVVIAASQLGIPVVCHESDYSMGLANKIAYMYCNVMCLSFDTQNKKQKMVFTGSPIRDNILKLANKKSQSKTTLDTILFMGGSLGSKAINDFVFCNIFEITKKYNVIHITGKNNINKSLAGIKNYKQLEYTSNISECYSKADIVVCRSGANTIFELLAIKKPMLLIPLSKKESRGDQIENAKYFKEHNYANVINENELDIRTFMACIKSMLDNQNKIISSMQSSPNNAKENIIEILKKERLTN